jgi:MFS family permease
MQHVRTGISAARPAFIVVTGAERRKVVFASSLGTVFEWYDFYLYATLAPFFASLFFPAGNDTAALLSAFATYAAGFLVRPLGAMFFGRIGDRMGRKYAFLLTVILMGTSTFAVGLLPVYKHIGWLAPFMLVLLRLAQGFALGGEYGGAATYVAEHTPAADRGLATGWVQTTATVGFLLSLLVIVVCRNSIAPAQFKEWGWRLPFLVSIILLVFSAYIRMHLNESPVYQHMKKSGRISNAPLAESFLQYPNLKLVVLALVGATAGQGVIWYTGQFYALFYMQIVLKLDYDLAYQFMMIALLIGTPFFVFFGWLSDKIGRKPVIMMGCFLAVVTYFPIFTMLTRSVNPDLVAFQKSTEITIATDTNACHTHIFIGPWTKYSDCDRAKDYLTKQGVSFRMEHRPETQGTITVGDNPPIPISDWDVEGKEDNVLLALRVSGYPEKADPAKINMPITVFLLTLMIIYACMVYGPMAAFLVELFPTRIRYTSMSLPYHIGNGWFGGVLPLVTTAMVTSSGNIYYGLWYPVVVAALSLVIGLLYLPDRRGRELTHD